MEFALINGLSIHYHFHKNTNDQRLIVFSNSLGTDFRIWHDCVDRLKNDFNILLYDKRGHGLSCTGASPYQINDHVNDLIGLMDFLRLSNALIVGLSVGGLIAQGTYHTRPDLVKALLLCDTAAKIGSKEMWDGRIAQAEKGGLDSLVEANMQRWFSPKFHQERSTDLKGFVSMFTRTPLEGYIGTAIAIRDADFREDAALITVPTKCVVGDQDGATTPEMVKNTADMIPNAQFEIIKNAGHIPCAENPDEITRIIYHMMEAI